MTTIVQAAARLHFGLLPPDSTGALFGGCGVMLAQPVVTVRIESADEWQVFGVHAEKSIGFVADWRQFVQANQPISTQACRVEVLEAPPLHSGLGTGTQLGLSIAAGLFSHFENAVPGPQALARSVKRGKRSAIGTFGFVHGGLLIDRGKQSEDGPVGELDFQLPLPEEWRWVISQSEESPGLSGDQECQAFERPPTTSPELRERMITLLKSRLVPAAVQGDFGQLSQAIYEYGYTAGMAFEAEQGGPFNGHAVTQLVEYCRSQGVMGVGQSSWGPTVFSLHQDREHADAFASHLQEELGVEALIAETQNCGAKITRTDSDD